jgi:hypothetical protein
MYLFLSVDCRLKVKNDCFFIFYCPEITFEMFLSIDVSKKIDFQFISFFIFI